jgi:hypothetical protein
MMIFKALQRWMMLTYVQGQCARAKNAMLAQEENNNCAGQQHVTAET